MDPHSQSFTPYNTSSNGGDGWRFQADLARIQQVQVEHSERLARLERRHDEDARVKSVWGSHSPFPSVLSGTPQQAALQQPATDQFRNFDEEAGNMMSSLHLDHEDEPRRGIMANSRANSVRFDETANQNHFSHSSRPSVEAFSRTSSGQNSLQMNERSASHRSEGRASSAHSIRSAASGRANSMTLDTAYALAESNRPLLDPPGLAPGLLLLGAVPAIIRCWMNTNFTHDALLYAAVCTGSYKSFLGLRLIQKLGFEEVIRTRGDGLRTVELPIFFPEAVRHPASSRSSSPAPQLPSLVVEFRVIENPGHDDSKAIQIFLGSDVLRTHHADILFSSNTMTLFDDDHRKLSIPLARPESEAAFNRLFVRNDSPQSVPAALAAEESTKDHTYLNGLGQGSSGASVTSSAASPPPDQFGVSDATPSAADAHTSGGAGSEPDVARPASAHSGSSAAIPPLSLLHIRSAEAADPAAAAESSSPQTTPLRSSATNPAVWSNWRREGGSASPAATAKGTATDWPSATRHRETVYQRRDTGIKVLKPKTSARTVSATATTPAAPASGSDGGKSRFFGEGVRRNPATPVLESADAARSPIGESKRDNAASSAAAASTPATTPKTKANPIGGASAFSWLNPAGGGSGNAK